MADRQGARRWRSTLSIGLLGGCAVVLGIHAFHGLRVTHDLADGRWHSEAALTSQNLTCLRAQVDAVVPANSRVTVDPALGAELWQRTLEVTWARATPVPPGQSADLTLTTAPGPPRDPCAGAVVAARPGPLPASTPTAPSAPTAANPPR